MGRQLANGSEGNPRSHRFEDGLRVLFSIRITLLVSTFCQANDESDSAMKNAGVICFW